MFACRGVAKVLSNFDCIKGNNRFSRYGNASTAAASDKFLGVIVIAYDVDIICFNFDFGGLLKPATVATIIIVIEFLDVYQKMHLMH